MLLKLQRAGLWLYSVTLGAAGIAMKIYTAVTSGLQLQHSYFSAPITLIIQRHWAVALGVGIYCGVCFLITRWDEIKEAALMDTCRLSVGWLKFGSMGHGSAMHGTQSGTAGMHFG